MDAKIRVMLADASAEFRLLLREALEETGEFQVVGETGDGSQVAALAAETHPQILLMDTMLPVLDGIGVLRQLREREERPRTIVLSAFYNDRMIHEAVDLGAYFFLPKPVSEASLMEHMRRAVAPPAQREPAPQLEGMVTAIIHEIGVPAHIKLSVPAGGHHHYRGRHGGHQRRDQGAVSGGGQALQHHAQPGGEGHPARHRGGVGPR